MSELDDATDLPPLDAVLSALLTTTDRGKLEQQLFYVRKYITQSSADKDVRHQLDVGFVEPHLRCVFQTWCESADCTVAYVVMLALCFVRLRRTCQLMLSLAGSFDEMCHMLRDCPRGCREPLKLSSTTGAVMFMLLEEAVKMDEAHRDTLLAGHKGFIGEAQRLLEVLRNFSEDAHIDEEAAVNFLVTVLTPADHRTPVHPSLFLQLVGTVAEMPRPKPAGRLRECISACAAAVFSNDRSDALIHEYDLAVKQHLYPQIDRCIGVLEGAAASHISELEDAAAPHLSRLEATFCLNYIAWLAVNPIPLQLPVGIPDSRVDTILQPDGPIRRLLDAPLALWCLSKAAQCRFLDRGITDLSFLLHVAFCLAKVDQLGALVEAGFVATCVTFLVKHDGIDAAKVIELVIVPFRGKGYSQSLLKQGVPEAVCSLLVRHAEGAIALPEGSVTTCSDILEDLVRYSEGKISRSSPQNSVTSHILQLPSVKRIRSAKQQHGKRGGKTTQTNVLKQVLELFDSIESRENERMDALLVKELEGGDGKDTSTTNSGPGGKKNKSKAKAKNKKKGKLTGPSGDAAATAPSTPDTSGDSPCVESESSSAHVQHAQGAEDPALQKQAGMAADEGTPSPFDQLRATVREAVKEKHRLQSTVAGLEASHQRALCRQKELREAIRRLHYVTPDLSRAVLLSLTTSEEVRKFDAKISREAKRLGELLMLAGKKSTQPTAATQRSRIGLATSTRRVDRKKRRKETATSCVYTFHPPSSSAPASASVSLEDPSTIDDADQLQHMLDSINRDINKLSASLPSLERECAEAAKATAPLEREFQDLQQKAATRLTEDRLFSLSSPDAIEAFKHQVLARQQELQALSKDAHKTEARLEDKERRDGIGGGCVACRDPPVVTFFPCRQQCLCEGCWHDWRSRHERAKATKERLEGEGRPVPEEVRRYAQLRCPACGADAVFADDVREVRLLPPE